MRTETFEHVLPATTYVVECPELGKLQGPFSTKSAAEAWLAFVERRPDGCDAGGHKVSRLESPNMDVAQSWINGYHEGRRHQ